MSQLFKLLLTVPNSGEAGDQYLLDSLLQLLSATSSWVASAPQVRSELTHAPCRGRPGLPGCRCITLCTFDAHATSNWGGAGERQQSATSPWRLLMKWIA